jgi:hypothetical protein
MSGEVATEVAPEFTPAEGRVLTNASPITIGKNETAPLGELLACRHRRCRHCSEGWVYRPGPGGSRISSVCRCCVLGWRQKRAKEAAAAAGPAIGVTPLPPAAVEERARRRVERLARDLAALEQERDQRVASFDARNADLIAAVKSAAATAQDESALALKAQAEVEHLTRGVADAEKRLGIMRAALAGQEAALAAHREAQALAQAMRADAEGEIERRRGTLALGTLNKEIAKTRRRLAAARSDLGGEPSAPEAA